MPPSLTVAVGTYFGRHGRCRAPPETAPGLPPAVRPLPQTAAATARSGDSGRAHAPLRGWVDPPLLKWRRGLDDVVRRSQDGGSARTRFREGGTKWRGARSPPLLIRVSARPPARRWRRPTPQLQSDLAVALPGAGTRVVGLAAPEGGGAVPGSGGQLLSLLRCAAEGRGPLTERGCSAMAGVGRRLRAVPPAEPRL